MVIADPNSPYAAATPAHALVVCAEAAVSDLNNDLENLGYRVTVAAEPYQALVELLERPLAYDAVVLSLPTLYRDELKLIRTVRERLGHLDVFVTHTDGRHAALAEAMRYGTTGLLGPEGIHRLAVVGELPAPPDSSSQSARTGAESGESATESRNEGSRSASDSEDAGEAFVRTNDGAYSEDVDDDALPDANEPLLTADELRALLQEQPTLPPT